MSYSRNKVVSLAKSWVGLNESDGSYKKIIDIYNQKVNPKPRGVKMQYNWAWCACTWSAIAAELGYTKIMPVEISCNELIKKAKEMDCWMEADNYTPSLGDAILYDWDDNGIGDNVGLPDHIGIVEYVNKKSGYEVVIEGNYSDTVKRRTISLNGRYIRGYIVPNYDDGKVEEPIKSSGKASTVIAKEVIAGIWGDGKDREKSLKKAGYDPKEIQKMVNDILNTPKQGTTTSNKKTISSTCVAKWFDKSVRGVYKTTADLYCRNDAGSNKKALCLIPKGTNVNCYGYFNVSNSVRWYYITFELNGVRYDGFSSSTFLKKVQ